MLWVGCGNMDIEEDISEVDPTSEEMIWHCFVTAEVSFVKKLLGRIDTSEGVNKLTNELLHILEAEPGIRLAEAS